MMNLDTLSQSATDAIGGLWQPPQSDPGVQYAAPAPPSSVTPPQSAAAIVPTLHRGHGLLDRIAQHLTGNPAGFDQVLSPQEMEDARPSLFGALFGGEKGQTPSEVYAARLDNLVKRHQTEDSILQQRNMLANRAAVLKAHPAPGYGATEDQIAAWANTVTPLLLGDKEVESTLGPLVDRFASNKNMRDVNAPKTQMAQLGSAVTTFDPTHKNADGTVGAFLDPTTHQWVTSLERGMTADQKKENATRDEEARQRLELGRQQLDDTNGNRAKQTFMSQNQMLVNSANQYAGAKAALQDAMNGVTEATKSAVLNFAATVDSRAQLRQGTIQYIQQLDPSWKGTVSAWFSKGLKGKLPADQMAGMQKVLDHAQYEKAKLYEQRYQGAVSRVPSATPFIPPTSEVFGDILDTYQPTTHSATPDINDVDAYLADLRKKAGNKKK